MSLSDRAESHLTYWNRRAIEHAHQHRRTYTAIACILFFSGLIMSAWTLELELRQIEIRLLLINLLIGAPTAIALNAVGLKISAGIVNASLTFRAAFRTCCIALCSNLLPIPAGSIIQTSSLASRGGSALQSGIVVTVGNALSLALILSLVGAVLAPARPAVGLLALAIGIGGLIAATTFIYSRTTAQSTLAFIGIRVLRTVTMVLRIQLSFLIIGVTIGTLDATLFSGAFILGTTLAFFPAGLGVSEGLAALLALATTIAPGAAFLATALNRVATLVFAGLFLLITLSTESDQDTHV